MLDPIPNGCLHNEKRSDKRRGERITLCRISLQLVTVFLAKKISIKDRSCRNLVGSVLAC